MSGEKPAVTVALEQDGLRGRTARIYDPGSDFVVDDSLVPAQYTDGSKVEHGQYVIIADDEPNVFGALRVHKPGQPDNSVVLQHYLLAVAADGS